MLQRKSDGGETDAEQCGVTAEEQARWYYMATKFQPCGHPADCILSDADGIDYCPLCEYERRKNRFQALYIQERQRAEAAEAERDRLREELEGYKTAYALSLGADLERLGADLERFIDRRGGGHARHQE